ncbi:ATP-grasp domain-containing protein [Deinococcus ruber]|uniref:ATP-grasp domain-containing protein n=1 Tax=Deinococcus ruber TaxID=1848197 RepID=A0A918F3C6_9DEIO|nr:ATP-grasp domain-containing protein [Deinococcus ruber]GGR03419.1 hypothetical protein GCM10008957_15370 [Deinococcus ruber]
MARILLTGGRAPATLELARLFDRQGHNVSVAESWRVHVSRFSRAVRRNVRVPPPRSAYPAFVQALEDAAQHLDFDLLVPTCEEVFWVARAKPLLETWMTVFCPSLSELRTLHDKAAFSELLLKAGLPGPPTTLLRTPADVLAYTNTSRAYVFKPAFSRFGLQTLVRPAAAELASIHPSLERPWVAQEYRGGQEWCAYAVFQAGSVAALAIYPARFPVAGASVYFRAVQHPGIQAWAEAFGRFTGLTGQAAFDFKEDENGLWALECNPRLTSGIHLFRDQPQVVRAFLKSQPHTTLHAAPRSPLALGAAMLLGGYLRSAENRRLCAAARDVIWTLHDPLPALAQPLLAAALAIRAARAGVGLVAATTLDIEWNGES